MRVQLHLLTQGAVDPLQVRVAQQADTQLEGFVERQETVDGGLGQHLDLVFETDGRRDQRQQFLTGQGSIQVEAVGSAHRVIPVAAGS